MGDDGKNLPTVTGLLRQAFKEQMPRYVRLLDREATAAQAEEIFQAAGWRYRAWVLADDGLSGELDELLRRAGSEGWSARHVDPVREWARSRTPG